MTQTAAQTRHPHKLKPMTFRLRSQTTSRLLANTHSSAGWSENNSAALATYQPGGAYTANESATLYAVWTEDADIYYFIGDGRYYQNEKYAYPALEYDDLELFEGMELEILFDCTHEADAMELSIEIEGGYTDYYPVNYDFVSSYDKVPFSLANFRRKLIADCICKAFVV